MANRLHKVIFSYINCLEFTFSVIKWRPLYQDRRNCSTENASSFVPVSLQSVSSDFLPEDQSDTAMSRDAWFTTLILFCFLKSVIVY